MVIDSILQAYGIVAGESLVEPLVSGLINRTWKVTSGTEQYILQRVNTNVFKKPYELAENISMLKQYLAKRNPDYLFVAPLRSLSNDDIVHDEQQGYFRLYPFIRGSHTINVVTTPGQAYEAALQFGKFTQLLSGFDASRLHFTIPDFHNLTLRYQQFELALSEGNVSRIKESRQLVEDINNHRHILESFEKLSQSALVKHRVTHHDTKISNVLFDSQDKGICVIDLDTVMSGYFISDLGDMMRTYLSPANEEEKDFSKIDVREDFFRAIVNGYLRCMKEELTTEEQGLIFYSGLFLVYMQAIRFLTDYFNNDIYYGATYADQNLVRAGNQICLLKKMMEKKDLLQGIVSDELNMKKHFMLS
jgi:Ser/Thr protein kinase RdoA (MazF antagonist)